KASLRRLSNDKGWVGCGRATGNPPGRIKPIPPEKIKKHLTGINKEVTCGTIPHRQSIEQAGDRV
ncbi:MAG TPA: hypothetical protein VK568_17055, partial [Thermodesulfobacteriota bacterium]|nr:hypothetical protein [Thermodesulfobacteriota bacterium]